MKFILNVLSVLLLASVIVCASGFYFAVKTLNKSGELSVTKTVVIKSGDNIANVLYTNGVIKNQTYFRVATRALGKSDSLQAGEYRFDAHVSIAQVIDMLANGDVINRSITIPEGLTSYEVVRIINANKNLSGEIVDIPAEGSLLPETYHFHSGMKKSALIKRMQSDASEVLDELWAGRDSNLPFKTKRKALILASIVEKETSVKSEYPIVAGVFINRLNKGMKLQTDPTVIYAITGGDNQNNGKGPLGRRLLRKDLSIDSPYNTYKYAGLPPTPISNAGRGALNGVLHPAKHDYIFFVADGDGGHAFAKTLAEHNKNAARWRAGR